MLQRWIVVSALCLILAAGCTVFETADETPAATANVPPGDRATVTRVIDGDTIDVRLGGSTARVSYVGINTPERDEPCYARATAANAALVEGQTVTLVRDVSDTDPYGRLLRYVYVGSVFVNAELVEDGYAEAGYYPPDTAYKAYFDDLEAGAQAAGRGCHPTGVFR